MNGWFSYPILLILLFNEIVLLFSGGYLDDYPVSLLSVSYLVNSKHYFLNGVSNDHQNGIQQGKLDNSSSIQLNFHKPSFVQEQSHHVGRFIWNNSTSCVVSFY